MNLSYNNIRNLSYSSSIMLHIILLLVALLINFAFETRSKEFIELSFGSGGFGTSGGSQGIAMEESGGSTVTEETVIQKTENKVPEVKEVKLPVSKTKTEDNTIIQVDKTKEIKKFSGQEIKIYMDDLPAGIYFIRINTGKFIETKKLIISK